MKSYDDTKKRTLTPSILVRIQFPQPTTYSKPKVPIETLA